MGATPAAEVIGIDRTSGRPVTWVVGSGGLLGSAVRRRAATRAPVVTAAIPWREPEAAVSALLEQAEALPPDGWRIAWCAGAGVVASSQEALDDELWVIREFLSRWKPALTGGSRAIFFASSAGGVYAGSSPAPFDERSDPVPVAPYGHAKLAAERLFADFSERTGVSLLVGRISNLYGPGQNLGKGQGLISLLCRAQLTGEPLSVFVPLDTRRDYLYIEDAAEMVLGGLDAVAPSGSAHVKVLASGRSVTVGEVIGELRRITRRWPPITLGQSDAARFQVLDLRMNPVGWPALGHYARTPLGTGIAATLASVEASLRCPQEGNR